MAASTRSKGICDRTIWKTTEAIKQRTQMTFEADDIGNPAITGRRFNPKQLCPVMLLVNLSNSLVNGSSEWYSTNCFLKLRTKRRPCTRKELFEQQNSDVEWKH